MIEASVEVEIPKGFDFEQVEEQLNQGLRESARDHRADMESFVMNWKHKPGFKSDEKRQSDGHSISIYPTGENAKYWRFVSFGTEGRIITPVRAPNLVFRYQGAGQSYVPKTTRGGGFGGAGKKIGPVRRFSGVKWPGIDAREFEKEVIKANRKEFEKNMKEALERGLKQAGGN